MRILLVEDSAAEAELLETWLSRGGAEVVRAHSDLGAYEALEADAGFDALVADLNLGFGTTGFEVARAARARRPGIPIVFVSGGPLRGDAETIEGALFVRKGAPSETARELMATLQRAGAGDRAS